MFSIVSAARLQLVLAAGAEANFLNIPGADTNSFPLYSLVDAERLRSRLLALFEDADREPGLIEQGALNIVVVGGGATGTEVAGALADLLHSERSPEYERLVNLAQVYLVEHGPTLLAPFSAKAHDYASKVLQRGGVILKLNTDVKEVHPGHVVLSDGSSIKSRCVIWGAGLKASTVASNLGCRKDAADESRFNTILASRTSRVSTQSATSPISREGTGTPCRSLVR